MLRKLLRTLILSGSLYNCLYQNTMFFSVFSPIYKRLWGSQAEVQWCMLHQAVNSYLSTNITFELSEQQSMIKRHNFGCLQFSIVIAICRYHNHARNSHSGRKSPGIISAQTYFLRLRYRRQTIVIANSGCDNLRAIWATGESKFFYHSSTYTCHVWHIEQV